MSNIGNEVLLFAVGDIGSERNDQNSMFQYIKSLINQGDIAFGQLEINISQRGSLSPQAQLSSRTGPEAAATIRNAGFNVISLAGNHCLDWGYEAFTDTMDALSKEQISVVGAGNNIEEARRPAVIDRNGTKIAFLAYNSILPEGYWATASKPGCNPIRIWTVYEQYERNQPGTPCKINTMANKNDLKTMIDDIRKAARKADIVIVSLHGGIHFTSSVLADYQKEIAHAAIDAGADLILGHHAHILKGVEIYLGKVIFYSLGNFAIDMPLPKGVMESPEFKAMADIAGWKPDPDFPQYPFPRDSRKTIIVKCIVSNKQIKSISFIPCYINDRLEPELPAASNPRFVDVVHYLDEVTKNQGLNAKFIIKGSEVIIHG